MHLLSASNSVKWPPDPIICFLIIRKLITGDQCVLSYLESLTSPSDDFLACSAPSCVRVPLTAPARTSSPFSLRAMASCQSARTFHQLQPPGRPTPHTEPHTHTHTRYNHERHSCSPAPRCGHQIRMGRHVTEQLANGPLHQMAIQDSELSQNTFGHQVVHHGPRIFSFSSSRLIVCLWRPSR